MFMTADAGRRGYGLLLEEFWDEARGHGLPLPTKRPISGASFCRARPKITSGLLRHMLHEVALLSLERSFGSERWLGHRVFAVDGCKVNLQRSDDLIREFGVPSSGHCPQILVSALYDVCAKVPIDVEIGPYASCERQQLFGMLESLAPGDVLVMDRGYPSHEVLQQLTALGIDFLVRVPEASTFAAVDSLRKSSDDEAAVTIDPPKGSPESWRSLEVRVIRLRTPDGGESFFLTSLKAAKYTQDELRKLYHLRWEVEEFYKLIKGPYLGQGQFRSKSPEGVRQEVHALMLFMAISRVVMAAAAESAGIGIEEVSQKAGVLSVAAYVTRLFLRAEEHQAAQRDLRALLERIARARYRKRPGRSAPRRSYRPHARWNSRGRVGG